MGDNEEPNTPPAPPPDPGSEATYGASPGAPNEVVLTKSASGLYKLPPGPGHWTFRDYIWGTKNVVDILRRASQAWYDAAPREIVRQGVIVPQFCVGDLSAHNKANIGHYTHKDGRAVDIFIFRNDRRREITPYGTKTDVWDPWGDEKVETEQIPTQCTDKAKYDQALTQKMIETILSVAGEKSIFFMVFNDAEVRAAVKLKYKVRFNDDSVENKHTDPKTGKTTITWVHYNHIHFHFLE
jgi:hypothetical protein